MLSHTILQPQQQQQQQLPIVPSPTTTAAADTQEEEKWTLPMRPRRRAVDLRVQQPPLAMVRVQPPLVQQQRQQPTACCPFQFPPQKDDHAFSLVAPYDTAFLQQDSSSLRSPPCADTHAAADRDTAHSHHDDDPTTTPFCSPALLQRQFSWGFLSLGATTTVPPEQQDTAAPLLVSLAPQLPSDDDDDAPRWRRLPPCFSPLGRGGRTTTTFFAPVAQRQTEACAPPHDEHWFPTPTAAAVDTTATAPLSTTKTAPILPASPLLSSTRISLPMRRNTASGFC